MPAQPSRTFPALIEPRVRSFLERPLFAALATIDRDGAPHQAVVWYRLEDDGRILLNSRAGRIWATNLVRDGRASLAVTDPEDGYAWLGLTGQVDAIDGDLERGREDIVALAYRYRDEPTPASIASFREQERITFRIAIGAVHDHLED